MTVTDPAAMIDKLTSMEDEEFREVVQRDLLREAAPEQFDAEEAAALRSPALVDRWLMTLTQISKNVEGQLSARAADYEATKSRIKRELSNAQAELATFQVGSMEHDMWTKECRTLENRMLEAQEKYSRSRAKSVRFKSGLEVWIIEARSIRDRVRDRLYDSVVAEERNRLAERTRALEEAIRTHRKNFPIDDTPNAEDEALWSLVD